MYSKAFTWSYHALLWRFSQSLPLRFYCAIQFLLFNANRINCDSISQSNLYFIFKNTIYGYFSFCVKNSSLKTWLKKKYLNFVELYKKAYPTVTKQKQYERAQWKVTLTFKRARFWSWKQKLRKLEHQSWSIGKKRSFLHQQKKQKKKEDESSRW